MKKYILSLVLILMLFTLVGCGIKIDEKEESNKEEEVKEAVNPNARYGLKSTVVDGKNPYSLDDYPTIKSSAIDIEDVLLKGNCKIKEIKLNKVTDNYIAVDYMLEDDYYVYVKFTGDQKIDVITYRNSSEDKVRNISKKLVTVKDLNIDKENYTKITTLEVGTNGEVIGNRKYYLFLNPSNEVVFQIANN